MYHCQGRFCLLEELTSTNDGELFSLLRRYRAEYEHLVSDDLLPESESDFKSRLNSWFSSGRIFQYLVRRPQGALVVGTVFSYGFDNIEQSVRYSCFFAPEVRNSALIFEALYLAVIFGRNVLSIPSVAFSIYAENQKMEQIAIRLGARRQGARKSRLNPKRDVYDYLIPNEVLESLLQSFARLAPDNLSSRRNMLSHLNKR